MAQGGLTTRMDKIRSRYSHPDMQLAMFRLGETDFGIALGNVKEIIRYRAPEASNEVPSFMNGFLRLREMLVPVVDLRRRFGLDTLVTELTRIIITVVDKHIVGLVVDEVNDIAALGREVKLMPYNESEAPWVCSIVAVVEAGSRRVMVMDADLILGQDEKMFLDAPLHTAPGSYAS